MSNTHEWDVEVMDEHGDIDEHLFQACFADCVAEAMHHASAEIVLVCDHANGDRSWAYLKNGVLPERFVDAYGHPTIKVPAKFHNEVKRHSA